MEVMTLDKAIQHCQEVAQGQSELYDCYLQHGEQGEHVQNCMKCGTEHRQLAEWLKDYKRLLEQEPCEGAIQALEQQRWHPISEEPPKKDEDYIITYKWIGSCSGDIYKEVVVSRYYGDGKWDVGNHEVLAWKPLPQPYKA